MSADVHARCRDLVLEGDAAVDTVVDHLDQCPACADLARRVAAVRRVAATFATAGAPPLDLADRTIATVWANTDGSGPWRRRVARAFVPRAAAAVALVAAAALVLGPTVSPTDTGDGDGLSDSLLVTAQRTEAEGSARLRMSGETTVATPTGPTSVEFGGAGELTDSRLHYRGIAKIDAPNQPVSRIAPFELTVVGAEAWTRQPDGTWLGVDDPVGPLAPLVLDAGSVLELLRLPKFDVRQVATEGDVRVVSFSVTVRPGLRYDVVVRVRPDDLLERVDVRAAGAGWRTEASLRLYGFGDPVTIRPPAAEDVVGRWETAPNAHVAMFPFG